MQYFVAQRFSIRVDLTRSFKVPILTQLALAEHLQISLSAFSFSKREDAGIRGRR